MHLSPSRAVCSREFVLLAPVSCPDTPAFTRVECDATGYERLLGEAQRLRGGIYLQDGAIEAWQLTADGRHVQAADDRSWHLLSVNQHGLVAGCARYTMHDNDVAFPALGVYHTALAKSKTWGTMLRRAVEDQVARARSRGISYAELGGWAISEGLRHTTEAVRMMVTVYGLSELLGGALGISTATTRHGSSSMLRRIGGRPLVADGVALPAYYDPHYKCEMEVLHFDSSDPSPRYWNWIGECLASLRSVRVIRALELETAPRVLPLGSYRHPIYNETPDTERARVA